MVGFAQKNEVKMIDEYDGLVKDLEPFWALSGEELRRRSEQVGHLPSIDVVQIRDGTSRVKNIDAKFKDSKGSARARGFIAQIAKFEHKVYYIINFCYHFF